MEALTAANIGGSVEFVPGLESITSNSTKGFDAALAAAGKADHVVLMLGLDGSVEGEGHDRHEIGLPGVQV